MGSTSLFGRYTTDHLCSIVEGLLGLESSLISSHALADDFSVLVDPDVGDCTEAVLDDF